MADFVKPESSQAESRFGFVQTLGALLPLPAGEGWGEGELHAQSISRLVTAMTPAVKNLPDRFFAWFVYFVV